MTARRPAPPTPPVRTATSYSGWAGRSHGWRYYAQRADGSGLGTTFLHNELRLQDVKMDLVVSGPSQLSATIQPVDMSIQNPVSGAMEPLILPERGTIIHAEWNGDIVESFLLMGLNASGPVLSLDGAGLTVVPKNLSYPTSVQFVEADPLDIIRHIWTIVQSGQDSNLGIVLDSTTTTDRTVGKAAVTIVPTGSESSTPQPVTSDDEGPYELNWWSTHDLGGEIDKLAEEHSIEYRINSVWDVAHTQVLQFLEFGYPVIGRRREGPAAPRFVVGENIQVMPQLTRDGDAYANEVVVLGAGEGSAMVRGYARTRDGRVRTSVTVDDKSITDTGRADRVAGLELARRRQLSQVPSVVIRNSGLSPLGSFWPGDEIRVMGDLDWGSYDAWARVNSLTINPDQPDFLVASLERTDWAP